MLIIAAGNVKLFLCWEIFLSELDTDWLTESVTNSDSELQSEAVYITNVAAIFIEEKVSKIVICDDNVSGNTVTDLNYANANYAQMLKST